MRSRELTIGMGNGFTAGCLALVLAACAPESGESGALPQGEGKADAASPDSRFACGDRLVELTLDEGRQAMRVDGRASALEPAPSASGAKFVSPENPETFFWSKGERATVAIEGEALPECRLLSGDRPKTPDYPITGRGHEPGWLVTIGAEEIDLVTDYGERELVLPTPAPEPLADGWRFAVAEEGVTVEIHDSLCRDSATGMPHPKSVEVRIDGKTLSGCGGEPRSLLAGRAWEAVSLDGEELPEGARPDLAFGATEARVHGQASCNGFTASYELTGEGIAFGPAASTRKACAPRLMEQEQAFFALLREVSRFDFDESGALVLSTAEGQKIVARPAG